MKKLLTTLLLALICSVSNAQDGLARWIDTDSIDVFISVFNSPVDSRIGVANLFLSEAKFNRLKAETFTILLDEGQLVVGETFIIISETYILFDIYIDEVKYSNGTNYHATRFEKPKGPIDYDKY